MGIGTILIFQGITNVILSAVVMWVVWKTNKQMDRQKDELMQIFCAEYTDYERTFVLQSRLIKSGHQHCCRCFRVSGITYKNAKGDKQKIQLHNFQKDRKICGDCKEEIENLQKGQQKNNGNKEEALHQV